MQQLLYEDQGYIYNNAKIPGKIISIGLFSDSLCIYKAGMAGMIGRSFGAVGAAAGTLIDNASGANSPMPETVIPFTTIASVAINKSFLSGAGIVFTLTNGTNFKISTQRMSFGGVKKIYPVIASTVKALNPNVSLDPAI